MKLYFGQINIGNAEFFKQSGKEYHSIEIEKSPHFQLLKGDEKAYKYYLEKSWGSVRPKQNSEKDRDNQVKKFKNLFKEIKENGTKKPIVVCEYKDRKIIVDGNHRAAINAFLKKEAPEIKISVIDYIKKITENSAEFYGTKNKGIPYQTISDGGNILLKGRRSDLADRMKLIDKKDMAGKIVADIGCNIGMAAFMAVDNGAKESVGLDVSGKLVTAALRINVLFGKPCEFIKADFSKKQEIKADTAFAFSINAHINNNKMLAENLKNFNVVYFETHQGSEIPREVVAEFEQEFRGAIGERKLYRLLKK